MKPPRETLVPVSAHSNAIAQARSFAAVARAIAAGIPPASQNHPDLLAYLVNAGLAIELHFKALMIGARSGRVTKGHDLSKLYAEFPEFFTHFLDWQFTQYIPKEGWPITMIALTHRSTPPPPPGETRLPKYGTFKEAVESSSRAFEDGRYFFEQVPDDDWIVFAYAPGPIDAVMAALDKAYLHFVAGDFAPKPAGPSQHAA